MASYPELLAAFKNMAPPEVLAKEGTPEFGDIFNKWTADVEKELGVEGWDAIPIEQVANLVFVPEALAETSTNGPAEQTILNELAPTITQLIQGDKGRTADVARLTDETTANYGTLRDIANQQIAVFDGITYFQQNPDVAAAYAALPNGTNGKKVFNGQEVGPNDFAKYHYDTYGKNEGRNPAYTSEVLKSNLANVAATTEAQKTNATVAAKAGLDALNNSITEMGTNLKGALAEQAVALQQAVTTLNQNLDVLDASQRKALADEIAAKQANLERSIAAQRQALEQQVTDLQGNATAAAQARRSALEQQIAELTAAQAPVAAARIRGAEALTTAINLGLESSRDQLQADAMREGFVGGSTMQDAALARAAIGARQDAARVGAQANLENAQDTRQIAQLGAGGRFSIADALAGQTQSIGDFGATGRAGLSTNLATGTQAIGDAGATGTRTIADQTAGNRANIGSFGAMTTLDNTNRGISAGLDLSNLASKGRYDIATALTQEEKDIANRKAAAEAQYRDTLFPNSAAAATAKAALPLQEAAAKSGLIPYGTAGTQNALNLLQWWNNGNVPAPSTTAVVTQPDQSGNAIANLGANVAGAAFKWWQPTVSATTTQSSVPASLAKTGEKWSAPWAGFKWGGNS